MNSSIWPVDGSLTGTTTPREGESESNGNEMILFIPISLRLEPHHQMQPMDINKN